MKKNRNSDPYKHQKKYTLAHYKTKSVQLSISDWETLNKRLKERNINFRKLFIELMKEQGLLD